MKGRVAVLRAYGGEFERVVSHVFPLERIGDGFARSDWRERHRDPLRISRAAVSM